MDGTLQAGNEHAVHSLMRLRAVGRAFGTSKTARKRGSAALQPLGRLVSNTPMREHRRWGCWMAQHNLYSKRASTLAALLPSILSKRLANASKTAKNAIERTRISGRVDSGYRYLEVPGFEQGTGACKFIVSFAAFRGPFRDAANQMAQPTG